MSTPIKTHTYPFARIFIRLAIVLAVLVLLGGIVSAGMTVLSLISKRQALRFETSPDLLIQTQKLGQLYEGTQKRILEGFDVRSFPESVPLVDFGSRVQAIERASQNRRPVMVEELVAETEGSVQAMQEFHAAGFVSAIEFLRQALLSHAAELRERFAPPPPAVPDPADPVASTSPATSAETASAEAVRSPRFRLFAETGTDANFADRRRMQTLEQVRELLNELREQSKREESLQQIRRAQIFLTRAEGLLDPGQLNEPAQLPAIQPTQTGQQRQDQAMVSAAERKAEELQSALEMVETALYSRWRVEDQLDVVSSLAVQEQQKAQRLAAESHAVLVSDSRSAGLTLLAALALAFAILVVSDFLRAFLNLSNNSDRLVALSPPAPPAPPSTPPPASPIPPSVPQA